MLEEMVGKEIHCIDLGSLLITRKVFPSLEKFIPEDTIHKGTYKGYIGGEFLWFTLDRKIAKNIIEKKAAEQIQEMEFKIKQIRQRIQSL